MVDPIVQLKIAALCFCVGLASCVVYEFLKLIKTWAKNNVFINFSFDFILFFIAGFSIFLVFLKYNYAQFAVFGVISMLVGFFANKVVIAFMIDLFLKLLYFFARKFNKQKS